MKAIVLYDKKKVDIGEFPEPALLDGHVKIKVSYCGICGTDIHKYRGLAGSRPVKYPVPLGHEVSGVIVEKGKSVDNLEIGERVTVDPNWYCKYCYYCREGKPHLCENGKGVVKGMATYICPPQENVYRIPDNLSLIEASLTEPLSCCIHGVDQANIKANDNVILIGFGSIGMMMLELLKLSDCNVIVVDIDESKRETALQMGAKQYINSLTESVGEQISNLHIDAIIECVGIKSTIEASINYASKGTRIVIFGVSDPEEFISYNPYTAFQKEIQIMTSFINPNTTQRAVDLLADNKIDTSQIIHQIIDMEQAVEEIKNPQLMKHGKVIVSVE